jgi:outer membrane protein assembly factor BamB
VSSRVARMGTVLVAVLALAVMTLGDPLQGTPKAAQEQATPRPRRPSNESYLNPGPATPHAIGSIVPPELTTAADDWPGPMGNLSGTRANLASAIDSGNVDQLRVAWTYPISAHAMWGALATSTLIVGDTVLVQDTASNVYALDRATGQVRWEHRYDSPTGGPNGLAVGYGMVYGTTGDDAGAFALDLATGDQVWRVQLANNPATSTDMAPLVYDNTVYVSTTPCTSQVCYQGGQRGILYALDATSGVTLWSFDTTTDNLWGNPRLNSGGGLWNPPSVDDEGNLYFGTGNAGPWPGVVVDGTPYPSGSSRPGANDYASSLVSLDPNGAVRWHLNAAPHDLFDHDFQLTPVLATVQIDGKPADQAVGSGKVGSVIAVERASGRIVWQTEIGRHENDDLRAIPAGETVDVYPGGWGVAEAPMAYAEGRIFVPILESGQQFTATSQGDSLEPINAIKGAVVALDAATGAIDWQTDVGAMNVCGLTVASDVVFTMALNGILRALDTTTGKELWRYQAAAGCNGSPAIAGDSLVVPAGGPLFGNGATGFGKAEPAVIAFRLEE